MEKVKTIELLNRLIEINNDRIAGYTSASEEIEVQDLKTLFIRFTKTSQKFNQDLTRIIKGLGGRPTEGTTIEGKSFRTWMDIRSSITGADRFVILDSCEIIDKHVVDTYEKILRNELLYLNSEIITIIRAQYSHIKIDLIRLKSIRTMAI